MPYADPEAQREYQRQWVAARKAQWLADNGPCSRCGSWQELEVDHIDPAKKVSHKVWSWSAERRNAELAKCQVLCCPCHMEKTLEGYPVIHGGPSAYEDRKCRCDTCIAGKVERNRRYRSRRGEQTHLDLISLG